MDDVITCSAPEIAVGSRFNGGVLLAEGPLPDEPGRYPSRIVLVDLGHEYVTWVASWPIEPKVVNDQPKWYCTNGWYFRKDQLTEAATSFDNRAKRGF